VNGPVTRVRTAAQLVEGVEQIRDERGRHAVFSGVADALDAANPGPTLRPSKAAPDASREGREVLATFAPSRERLRRPVLGREPKPMPRSHPGRVAKVAALLLASGACSLVYETVWLRELRLVFGASTTASAVVVACFVGGLGAGALLFGKRADGHPRPLALYSLLEGGIALSAAATPFLLWLVRASYVAVGGTRALGGVGGSTVRLLLSAVVFALPTVLMGGTLPAVARAVESHDDRGRRLVAVLYGANTLGAVTGCMLSTFLLFETFGNRLTLWIACLVNLLVAGAARILSRAVPETGAPTTEAPATGERGAPAWFALAASAVAGFVFCLMELVWYRMLGPLLGGTVFTFGLVLALALLGIGLGGVAYGVQSRKRATTASAFAWTCLAEAVCVAVPYALGDRLAILAVVLRPVDSLSFARYVGAWAAVAGIVVLPAAFVSGIQFPLLVGLLGRGDERVGRDVGRVYATNTVGAIAGSLAGGFGLIPLLTAPGCWRLIVLLLVALGACAMALDVRRRPLVALAPGLLAVVALALLRATGPTAVWRHNPIGAGRVNASALATPNEARNWERLRRRAIGWEAEGRESSVAIAQENGLAFVVNGKTDGNARGDASTQVMLGLVGALLHPHPTRAMVIGLGTGESAGWLADIPTMTAVDVAELEPAILEVARRSEVANRHALLNPKVHVEIGDARELLLTSRQPFDLVVSEPSNPYRAGIASLFTREYYEAAASRLGEDGLFLQWIQAYGVHSQTIHTVYATLHSVFPEVETWELMTGDMLLVGAKKPIDHDVARLRARMAEDPYRSALSLTWRSTDPETLLSHFVASSGFARQIAAQEGGRINTDDENLVEFGFAKSVGAAASFSVNEVRDAARKMGQHRPSPASGDVDWDRVDDAVVELDLAEGARPDYARDLPGERAHRVAALRAFDEGRARKAVAEWRAQPLEPTSLTATALIGSAFAETGDERALAYAEGLRATNPGELDAIVARLRLRQGRLEEAAEAFEDLFVGLRTNPWPMVRLVRAALEETSELVRRDARLAPRMYEALREPFALLVLDDLRRWIALGAALAMPGTECVEAVGVFEPNVPWDEAFLRSREECYRRANDARAGRAGEDLAEWRSNKPEAVAATGGR
jgi:spermidine synthase